MFYVYGKAEKAIGRLLGLKAKMQRCGYCIDLHMPTAGEVVAEKAQCCQNPDIYAYDSV